MKSRAFPILPALSESTSIPSSLSQSHLSLVSPPAHTADPIRNALNPGCLKCGSRMPAILAVLASPRILLELQIPGLSPDLLNQNL